MKWSGQHIYDLISRFRDSVYLEDLTTTTETNVLVVDSNGEVGINTTAGGDITGVDLTGGTGISIASETGTTAGNYSATINCNVEGVEVVSTDETGATKFLREDGDGTCSWQNLDLVDEDNMDSDLATKPPTQQSVKAFVEGKKVHDLTAPTASFAMNSQKITGLATPVADTDGSTKAYADRPEKLIKIYNTSFTDDISTDKICIAFNDGDSENTATDHIDMPIVAPYAGKLLKIVYRINSASHNGDTHTWRLETQASGVSFGTGPSVVGTQSGSAPARGTAPVTMDFTSSLDSGTNAIAANDCVYVSIQNNAASGSTKFYVSLVFEYDVSDQS